MTLSARKIVALIQESLGLSLPADSVDTFKAGNPDALVRGVAVTMMPTLDVLQAAVEAGCNMVISHEPLFYNHGDDTENFEREDDAVWKAKRDFLARHELILWRFHDLPHLQRPDAITSGMVEELGWRAFQDPQNEQLFTLPPRTLQTLAQELRTALDAQTLRVVGDRDLEVSRVALSPGSPGFGAHRRLLQDNGVEALIIGEAPEWETIAYVWDAMAAGMRKALVILGHIPSEQGGMKACAAWLDVLLPVPVAFLPTREPFWFPCP